MILSVAIARVSHHAGAHGELMLKRLCGMPGRIERGGDGKPWLVVTGLTAEQVEGIVGLLTCWGVPSTAIHIHNTQPAR